jgi:hypothetical protein
MASAEARSQVGGTDRKVGGGKEDRLNDIYIRRDDESLSAVPLSPSGGA